MISEMNDWPCPHFRYQHPTEHEPADHWCRHPESDTGECCEEDCPLKAERPARELAGVM